MKKIIIKLFFSRLHAKNWGEAAILGLIRIMQYAGVDKNWKTAWYFLYVKAYYLLIRAPQK